MGLTGLMPHKCTIRRGPSDVDDYGHPIAGSKVDITVDVRCRFSNRLSNLRGMGGLIGEGDRINWRQQTKRVALLILPLNTDLLETDQVINIKDVNGVIISSGPWGPLLVRTTYGAVSAHHMSAVIEHLE